jgi:signal transduction histidine kinase
VLLIRGVVREVEQREQLAELNKKLQLAYEEVDRLSKAKSEFISIASHQLRTPLTAIKGYISMLIEGTYGAVPKIAKKPLENVYESNERLINLVNNLLDISRIEAGRMEFEPEEAQIEDIIESVVAEFKITADQKKLYLKYDKPAQFLPKLLLDKDKIRQVFLNLINNSIKYTNQGGITIKIKNQTDIKNTILITISDTGEGMTKEDLAKLFESFSRGSVGVQLSAEGAGLGLYIARKFVEMHKGKIWAESEGKGKGSTFYVELPTK